MQQLESPVNMEQKTICLLLLDVSGSMEGEPIRLLNEAIQEFYFDIANGANGLDPNTKDRLEISVVSFDDDVQTLQKPALVEEFKMPKLTSRGGRTCTCKALKSAIDIVSERKAYYDSHAIDSARPWIVLMTDGNPYPDTKEEIQEISEIIKNGVTANKYRVLGIGVGNSVNIDTLQYITGDSEPLQGLKFGEFFKWLSRSMSIVSNKRPGEKADLSKGVDKWKNQTV
jgi:uncharacterized protein YegL